MLFLLLDPEHRTADNNDRQWQPAGDSRPNRSTLEKTDYLESRIVGANAVLIPGGMHHDWQTNTLPKIAKASGNDFLITGGRLVFY